MVKAIPLLLAAAMMVGCEAAQTSRPPDPWASRTASFLWSTIEPSNPYPIIHLPSGIVSVYDESAAAIALSRLTSGGLSRADVAKFVSDVRSRRDPTTGLVKDNPAVSGVPATWNTLRALDALGQHDVLDRVWQRQLLRTVVPVIDDPAKVEDGFDRADYFRIAGFLTHHGDGEVSAAAARALAGSPAGRGCGAVFAGTDVDLWAARAEIASAAGAHCTLSSDHERQLLSELEAGREGARRDNLFTIGTIERLRSVQLLHRLQGARPGPLTDAVTASVTALRTAVAAGRVEARPVPLADASEIIAVSGRDARIVPEAQDLLRHVLTWGSQFSRFEPSVPLFLYIVRSLLVLEGSRDAAERLAGLVNWSAVEGVDKLALATYLRPDLLTAATVREGIRQAARMPAKAGQDGVWQRASAGATIARAAVLGRVPCEGEVRTWVSGELAALEGEHETLSKASLPQLLIIAALLRFARSCQGSGPMISTLLDEVRRRAPGQLESALRDARTQAGSANLRGLHDSLELACQTDMPIPNSAKAEMSSVLAMVTGKDGKIGVVDSAGQFLPGETFAVVRSRQIVANECGSIQ